MNKLAKEGMLDITYKVELATYESCLVKKIARKLFEKGKSDDTPL